MMQLPVLKLAVPEFKALNNNIITTAVLGFNSYLF